MLCTGLKGRMKKYIWLVIVSGLCLGLFSCEDGEFYFDDEEGDEERQSLS